MSHEAVARRYARAIFEIGKQEGSLAELTKQMSAFADAYAGNIELRQALGNPLVAAESREAILADVGDRLGLSDTAKNAMKILARNRRLAALPDLARQLARLADEEAQLLRAVVTSAAPLSEGYLARLKAELEKATGKKVAVVHEQDPTLIAGVVTRIGDRVIDGSARARLQNFRDSTLAGGLAPTS